MRRRRSGWGVLAVICLKGSGQELERRTRAVEVVRMAWTGMMVGGLLLWWHDR